MEGVLVTESVNQPESVGFAIRDREHLVKPSHSFREFLPGG